MNDQTEIPLAARFDEAKGPVVLCHRCFRGRVQFDWRKGPQYCADCLPAVPV